MNRASAIALALFSTEAAAPAAVLTTFGILYFVWLGLRVARRSP
ncbi:MAG: hypothetical protein ACUVX1_08215 [Chloroflexota bacterium]